jgi:hypothetical protein
MIAKSDDLLAFASHEVSDEVKASADHKELK